MDKNSSFRCAKNMRSKSYRIFSMWFPESVPELGFKSYGLGVNGLKLRDWVSGLRLRDWIKGFKSGIKEVCGNKSYI